MTPSISRTVTLWMLLGSASLAACRAEPPASAVKPGPASAPPAPAPLAAAPPAPAPSASAEPTAAPDAAPDAPPAPVSEHLRCSVDADCTLSTFTCSRCGRCPGPPAIVSVAWENEQRSLCEQDRERRRKQAKPGRRDPPPRCAPCRPLPDGARDTWPKAARCDDGVCRPVR